MKEREMKEMRDERGERDERALKKGEKEGSHQAIGERLFDWNWGPRAII